ncbi:FAD-binding protein, partial [Pseudomonas sp. MAFF212428]|nr:FAD-binding protein [Pseudomonas brassicae]
MNTALFDPAHGSDRSAELLARVQQAIAERTPLFIRGGASKTFYGRAVDAQPLNVGVHTGIVSYDPTELVITARAGTPLRELQAALARGG